MFTIACIGGVRAMQAPTDSMLRTISKQDAAGHYEPHSQIKHSRDSSTYQAISVIQTHGTHLDWRVETCSCEISPDPKEVLSFNMVALGFKVSKHDHLPCTRNPRCIQLRSKVDKQVRRRGSDRMRFPTKTLNSSMKSSFCYGSLFIPSIAATPCLVL